MRFIKALLPHLGIAMLLGLAAMIILDGYNPLMEFLTGKVPKIYMLVMCAVCISALEIYITERNK